MTERETSGTGWPGDAELGALYRRAPRPEPPAALDQRIRRAAHSAASPAGLASEQATQVRQKRVSFRRWSVPLALAATVMVSIGIMQTLRHEVTSQTSDGDEFTPGSRQLAPATPTTRAKASGPREPLADEADGAIMTDAVGRLSNDEALRQRASEHESAPAPEGLAERRVRPLTARKPATPAGPAAAKDALAESAPAAAVADQPAEPVPQRRPADESSATSDADSTDASETLQESVAESVSRAKAWLERIAELRQRGEDEQVAVELERFRTAYPDYPLPPSAVGE